MKKPALAALGVVGACAACCAIPVALPLLGGLSALGITGLGAGALGTDWELALAVGAGASAVAVAGRVWWKRGRKAAACAAPVAKSNGALATSGCGCANAQAQGTCR
jgi:hypothetical protein